MFERHVRPAGRVVADDDGSERHRRRSDGLDLSSQVGEDLVAEAPTVEEDRAPAVRSASRPGRRSGI
jgi:hypothetical protein